MPEHKAQSDAAVAGRNPVIELLRSGRPVDQILMAPQTGAAGSLSKITAMAREQGIPVKQVARERLDALFPGVAHQGVAAVAAACRYASLEEIYARAGDEPLFVVILDGIEDPHNLGAIIRSAEAAGAHGVVIPRRGAVGLTATVMKASAGAAQHLPVARVANLAATLEELKKKNVWIYVADIGGSHWCTVDYSGAAALVIGAEGCGVSRLLRERGDLTVSLPMRGRVGSLNASVAAGVLLYEIARQRLGLQAK